MSAQQSHNNTPQTENIARNRFLWVRGNFAYCLAVSALLWGVGVAYYIEHFIGWSSITALAPADFGIFILTITLPLFLLWFFLAYIERSGSLDANARLFQTYVDGLMFPDAKASQSAHAFAKVMQEQVALLQRENREVFTQSAKIKSDLDMRVTELANILHLLDDYSAKTLISLNDGVKELADRCSYVTEKMSVSADNLRNCSQNISQNSDAFLSKLSPILDEISAVSSNIKNNIADNKNYLTVIKNQLTSCADLSQQHINTMLSKTSENAQRIERSFYKAADEYEALYKRLDTSISSIEGRVEDQKKLIKTQSEVIDQNAEMLNDRLSKYGVTVSQEIDKLVKNSIEIEKVTKKQIATLKAVNSETGMSIRGISDIFDEKRVEIERRCEYAVNSMQNVIIAINKETEKLMSFTNMTQIKNRDLQDIAETIVDKIGDMSNKLALKTDTLKDKAVEVIDKFTQASELITHSTDKISRTSNLMLNNSQNGVKLLEEQNFYITNALSNIDAIRDKLNRLREDVTDTATLVTHAINEQEKQVDRFQALTGYKGAKINPLEPEFDREKIITAIKIINQTFRNIGVIPEKLYSKQDMFDLWDSYLAGKTSAFTDVLSRSLTHKLSSAIRKAFDDNAEFHNQVIRYLFLMDILLKDISNSNEAAKNELINFAVNSSLDKIYFILVKTLNSAE